ncbi:MAG: helix-turn-helix domain-containing protein [Candidatus Eisenbacteria bacterium]|nr:helix-turn-helix domain-containing protein [Candidatus Eisenbacteria bacterium]
MKPLLYRVTTVARMLDMNRTQVYKLVKSGLLKAVNTHPGGRGMRILAASVENFVERSTISPDFWQK